MHDLFYDFVKCHSNIKPAAYDLPKMKEHLEKNPEFMTDIEQLRDESNTSGALMGVFPEVRAKSICTRKYRKRC